MKSFSQRMGLKPVKDLIQKDGIDDDLRIGLWNTLQLSYWPHKDYDTKIYSESRNLKLFLNLLWHNYFRQPLDTIEKHMLLNISKIREYYFSCEWYEVYDLIEFCVENYPNRKINKHFIDLCNDELNKELSAYRFVGNKIIQITSEEEISEIEDALQVPLKPVKEHLIRSIELFANREKPDYRNSIKESISAVEAACILITGDEKTTLGKALGKLERERKLNPALKSSFSSLYGYTSSDDGIRHALTDESNLDIEDAKFMLVSCSAFINYLVVKASKVGIDLAAPSPE